LAQLLARPAHQRRIEYKYRCAQAIIFGLPVLGLQYLGPKLGGAESPRWIAILQALLAGWVVYVGAAGMLFEGLVSISNRGNWPDLVVALISLGLYFYSLGSVLAIFFTGHLAYQPLLFHVSVILLGLWSGIQWWRFSSR
jgi:hypothetical protein